MKNILVIGCGVIGMTTAIRLQEAGFQVSIISKDLPEKTVSAKAAAIWLPFKVEPLDLVNQWSLQTYHKMEAFAKNTATGISMVDLLVLAQNSITPPWKAAMPEKAFRPAKKNELPEGYAFGNIVKVPLIETPVYLNYLLETFKRAGGELILQEVQSIEAVKGVFHQIINCTGLGARELVHDKSLYPIRGQVIKADRIPSIPYIIEDNGPNALAYIIPRKDCIILGGTAQKDNNNQQVNTEDTEIILGNCKNIHPKLQDINIQSIEVGLRPARPAIRLEQEEGTNIIHNYGHGGGGFTVSWGCADEVLRMIG